jgi:hypothetical protein
LNVDRLLLIAITSNTTMDVLQYILTQHILPYINDPRDLLCTALSCKAAYQALQQLPLHHALLLTGTSKILEGIPIDIKRALSIIIYGRCEFKHCHRYNQRSPHLYKSENRLLSLFICPHHVSASSEYQNNLFVYTDPSNLHIVSTEEEAKKIEAEYYKTYVPNNIGCHPYHLLYGHQDGHAVLRESNEHVLFSRGTKLLTLWKLREESSFARVCLLENHRGLFTELDTVHGVLQLFPSSLSSSSSSLSSPPSVTSSSAVAAAANDVGVENEMDITTHVEATTTVTTTTTITPPNLMTIPPAEQFIENYLRQEPHIIELFQQRIRRNAQIQEAYDQIEARKQRDKQLEVRKNENLTERLALLDQLLTSLDLPTHKKLNSTYGQLFLDRLLRKSSSAGPIATNDTSTNTFFHPISVSIEPYQYGGWKDRVPLVKTHLFTEHQHHVLLKGNKAIRQANSSYCDELTSDLTWKFNEVLLEKQWFYKEKASQASIVHFEVKDLIEYLKFPFHDGEVRIKDYNLPKEVIDDCVKAFRLFLDDLIQVKNLLLMDNNNNEQGEPSIGSSTSANPSPKNFDIIHIWELLKQIKLKVVDSSSNNNTANNNKVKLGPRSYLIMSEGVMLEFNENSLRVEDRNCMIFEAYEKLKDLL